MKIVAQETPDFQQIFGLDGDDRHAKRVSGFEHGVGERLSNSSNGISHGEFEVRIANCGLRI
jgi:hypothetical protein